MPTTIAKNLIKYAQNEIRSLRTSSLARNASWMLIGQGFSFLLQAAYFVLLARLLGVREYGVFAGAYAFVGIAMPYSTLGSGLVFVRHVGAKPDLFSVYWGHILFSCAVVGTSLALIISILAPYLLNSSSASIVLLVGIGNCVFAQLVNSMGFVFQAYEKLHITAGLNILTNALRLLAVVAMVFYWPHPTARQWAWAVVLVSFLAALIGFSVVVKKFGRPEFIPRMLITHAAEGLGFSLGWSAQSIYNDIDKTLLSHYGMNLQNGIYTMSYRIVDIASIPITALDAAALPRYIHDHAKNNSSVSHLAFQLALRASLIGLLMAAVMFVAAPLIPYLVGQGFSEGIEALRWLCLLPALRGIHQLTGSALTGMGLQRFRTCAQLSAGAINLLLNLWLIPIYGWLGAAWVSLITDGLLAVTCFVLLQALSKRQWEVL
jgi:O-antigen/teichoic acid export membrane protein